MITEIENAIIDRLETGGLAVRDIDVRKGAKGIIYPAVFVSTEIGNYSKVTQTKFKCEPTILVAVVFKHHASEKKRRHGIYPILEAVLLRLMLQTLGLEIKPLRPIRFRNITDRDLAEDGLLAYQFEFATSYVVEMVDDEVVEDLLKVGLEYYLQDPEDDEVKDAEDIVELSP